MTIRTITRTRTKQICDQIDIGEFVFGDQEIPCLDPAHYRVTFVTARDEGRSPVTMKLCTFHRTDLLSQWGVSVLRDIVI